MALRLKTLAVLPKDPSLLPRTHRASHTVCNSRPSRFVALFLASKGTRYTCNMHTGTTPIQIKSPDLKIVLASFIFSQSKHCNFFCIFRKCVQENFPTRVIFENMYAPFLSIQARKYYIHCNAVFFSPIYVCSPFACLVPEKLKNSLVTGVRIVAVHVGTGHLDPLPEQCQALNYRAIAPAPRSLLQRQSLTVLPTSWPSKCWGHKYAPLHPAVVYFATVTIVETVIFICSFNYSAG